MCATAVLWNSHAVAKHAHPFLTAQNGIRVLFLQDMIFITHTTTMSRAAASLGPLDSADID